MNKSRILEELFDSKIIAVLKILINENNKKHYLQELAETSNVPVATCLRILTKLERLEIITVEKISRFRIYTLNPNPKTDFLTTLFKEDTKVLEVFVKEIKNLPGLESIILHGKETKNKANLVIIGNNIDNSKILRACNQMKEKYGFLINQLTLTKIQYEQINQMGGYSGIKKTLL